MTYVCSHDNMCANICVHSRLLLSTLNAHCSRLQWHRSAHWSASAGPWEPLCVTMRLQNSSLSGIVSNAVLEQQSAMSQRQAIHYFGENMKGSCPHCENKYFARLDRHIRRIHGNNSCKKAKRPTPCEIALITHLKTFVSYLEKQQKS